MQDDKKSNSLVIVGLTVFVVMSITLYRFNNEIDNLKTEQYRFSGLDSKVEILTKKLEELEKKPLQLADGAGVTRPVHIENLTVGNLSVVDTVKNKRINLRTDTSGFAALTFYNENFKRTFDINSSNDGNVTSLIMADKSGKVSLYAGSLISNTGVSTASFSVGDYGKWKEDGSDITTDNTGASYNVSWNGKDIKNNISYMNGTVAYALFTDNEAMFKDTYYQNGKVAHRNEVSKYTYKDFVFSKDNIPRLGSMVFPEEEGNNAAFVINNGNRNNVFNIVLKASQKGPIVKTYDNTGDEVTSTSFSEADSLWSQAISGLVQGAAGEVGRRIMFGNK